MGESGATTASRLLHLLSVLQARHDWTADELARRLEVTTRTVRRDVDRLRRLGYTVDSRTGTGGGYQLGFGTGMPPLLLDGDEAVAVAVALRSTTASGVLGTEEAALQALVKLEQALPAALRRRVELLQQTVVPLTGPGPVVAVDTLLAVAQTVRDRRQLHADYVTHSGREARLLVEPHALVHVRSLWYLLAWNPERDDWRTYRLDRLTPRSTGRAFTPHEDAPDAREHVSAGITTSVYPFRCRLTVRAPAAVVGELVGPLQGQVRALDDSSCEVTGGSVSLQEMALWVARLDQEVVVHEPPELRAHLRRLGRKLADAAEPEPA